LKEELTCIVCPISCRIEVRIEEGKATEISGYKCLKGKEYAAEEAVAPKRMLTTTVLLENGALPLLSVRTEKPIPKTRLFEAMEVLRRTKVSAPVELGQVVVKNLLDLDVDVIATRRAPKSTADVVGPLQESI
jgi:CxxC motif-containing protein